MPDHDPQNIPVLDDIIEQEKIDDIDIAAEEINFTANDEQADNNFDLFNNETDDDSIEATVDTEDAEHHEPEAGSIDDIVDPAIENATTSDSAIDDQLSAETETIETEAVEIEADEIELVESALIGYPEEESSPVIDSINFSYDEQLTTNLGFTDNENTVPVPQVSLESITDGIVDNIVEQLLPDLEQPLRLLVQQVLEDKLPGVLLPEALLNKDTTDEDTAS